jgi:hypothetical protein
MSGERIGISRSFAYAIRLAIVICSPRGNNASVHQNCAVVSTSPTQGIFACPLDPLSASTPSPNHNDSLYLRTLNLAITFGTEWGVSAALEPEVENPKRRLVTYLSMMSGACAPEGVIGIQASSSKLGLGPGPNKEGGSNKTAAGGGISLPAFYLKYPLALFAAPSKCSRPSVNLNVVDVGEETRFVVTACEHASPESRSDAMRPHSSTACAITPRDSARTELRL